MNKELTPIDVTPQQIDLVKKTVAAEATDAELNLYLYDCARHGVHPLDKLLHFTKRGGRYAPVTSIDLMRIRAHDTGECLGIGDPVFTGPPAGPDFTATCTVTRMTQGQRAEFVATARWPEYYPGDGNVGIMWRKMPHTLLGKCAEALALRKGFPRSLSGLYAKEEMDQASVERPVKTVPPLIRATRTEKLSPEDTPDHRHSDSAVGEQTFVDLIVQAVEEPREGKPSVYVIAFAGGKVAKTLKKELAGLAEDWMMRDVAVEAKIKPGRLPHSWELVSLPALPDERKEDQE